MAIFHVHGTVVHMTPLGLPVRGAKVRIFDVDQGGNGDDELFVGTTDANGIFDGDTIRDWKDINKAAGQIRVPAGGHWEIQHGVPVYVLDYKYVAGEVEVPDVQLLQIQIQWNGKSTARVPYVGVNQVYTVPWPAPLDLPGMPRNPVPVVTMTPAVVP